MNKNNRDKKIILLTTACDYTNILYSRLSHEFTIDTVIVEQPISKILLLKRRIKKTGILNVTGQLLFMLFVIKYLRFFSKKRKAEILTRYNLKETKIPSEKVTTVSSVNNEATIRILQELKPDLVIVNGTRIISKEVIASIKARFINIHAGITPLYRGVHGAYWAMAMGDREHCGVTIHYVDTGIDTGGILRQGIIKPEKEDNFITYPYLQFAIGVELFVEVIKDFTENRLEEKNAPKGLSKLWYHPTLWSYLYLRIFKRIK